MAEPALLRLALRQGEARQDRVALEHHVALLGEQHGLVARLGEVAQRLAHLLLGLHVELVVLEAHAVGVVDRRARADAQHDVLRAGVLAREVVEVVGGDGLEAGGARHLGELVVQLGLGQAAVGANALVLQLDVEVALVEAAREALGPCHRVVELAVVEELRDDARDAGRRADDAVAVLLQHAERRARLVVEVVHVRLADELDQVVVALVGLGQKQQVVQAGLVVLLELLVGGEVHLAAEDGLDALARLLLDGVARVGKLRHARHHAVVGDGDGRHVQLGGAADHVLDVGRSVEQGVFGVVMKMHECHEVRLSSCRLVVACS